MKRRVTEALLTALLVLPTQEMDEWRIERFSKAPNNEVSASQEGMLVRVKGSASPLIYPLKSLVRVSGFRVSGEFRGLPRFKDVSQQGKKRADDYPLRVGFVVPGEKRISGLKKLFAPSWIRHLYAQVPEGSGVDHVRFFNVTQNRDQLGKEREHPTSELMREEFFGFVERPGTFSFQQKLRTSVSAVAVWISIDGDDTNSEYDVLLSKLQLITEGESP